MATRIGEFIYVTDSEIDTLQNLGGAVDLNGYRLINQTYISDNALTLSQYPSEPNLFSGVDMHSFFIVGLAVAIFVLFLRSMRIEILSALSGGHGASPRDF